MTRPHLLVLSRRIWLHGVGGMERHTQELVEALKSLGWRVTVVTAPGVRPVDLDPTQRILTLAGADPRGYGRAWRRGLLRLAEQLYRQDPYAGIISQSTAGAPLLSWAAARKVPLCFVVHTTARDQLREPVEWSMRGLYRRVRAAWAWRENRRLLPTVPLLATVSAEVAERLRRDLGGHGRFYVMDHGIDPRCFRPPLPGEREAARRQFGLPLDRVVAGASGRLTRQKGIGELSQWRPSALWLALSGERAGIGGGGGVTWVGPLDKEAQGTFLRALDLFAFPSRHREGMPMAVLEAMATGLAVVAYRQPALEAVLGQGRGLLVETSAEFYRALEALAADLERRQAMGDAAARWAAAHLPPWPAQVAGLLQAMGLSAEGR